MELRRADGTTLFGAGIDKKFVVASLKAGRVGPQISGISSDQ
jgi:hypothetical protein